MNVTDIFIRRPVLASVVSLVILVLGLRALFALPVLQFPQTQSAAITVTTAYYGANPDVIAGFITTPLEASIAQAQGIDYMTSSSTNGASTITVNLRLNYDANRALTEISAKVNAVINQLPPEAQQPRIAIANNSGATAAMFINFIAADLEPNQLSDYLIRVVQPKLQTVPGVQNASVGGARLFALRAWLDPRKLAAMNLTAADITNALANNNYLSAVGATKGQMISVNLTAATDLHTVEEFRKLIVKRKGDALVRLEDVATVSLGAESYDINAVFDNKKSVAIMIEAAPDANLLEVTQHIRKIWPSIIEQLPAGMEGTIDYDATVYVRSAINEVIKTLIEALVIVTIVIFLFTGTARSVIIPALAMPLSLIGAFAIMLTLGYSINLLTLLALVLAIGLVVDDAIIVVENVDRHMKEGMTPMQAALAGARELTGPIIAISIVLIAVYIPIGFQGGLTGKLFTEFAFTLAGAVGVSAVIALTLSPMMCARMFKVAQHEGKLARMIDANLDFSRKMYQFFLRFILDSWPIAVTFGFIVIGLIFVLGKFSQNELAPTEDQGLIVNITTGPPNTTPQQMEMYSKQVYQIVAQVPELDHTVQFDGFGGVLNRGFAPMIMKPWSQRARKTPEISQELQKKFDGVAGARIAAFLPPSLPGGGSGLPFAFVIKTTEPFANLNEVADALVKKAQESGMFYFIDNDLKYDKPQTSVIIDREKAALLGLNMRDVGTALGSMLGGGYVNYFSMAGRSYKVIPQVLQADRLNPDQLKNYFIRTQNGSTVPASTIISLKSETVPEAINHFQQLNSATISGITGVALGDALKRMREIAVDVLPTGYEIDYAGQSRQNIQESNNFASTLAFAILIIFLVLAAQFESFRDPLIVMASVPMAIFGAMVFIFLGVATFNIYTQVGLITLIGLIAKHGILIVQYANEEQRRGKDKRAAIEAAAGTRLRPILMTTSAMVLGAVPLVFSSGAGAVSRNNMGIIIATGISIGTLFTLFIVPAMYLFLAQDHAKQRAEQAELGLERLPGQH
ncbi:MAG TPA: efflux RND transporter permease subunit [Spongiibacteraceae bacterium]